MRHKGGAETWRTTIKRRAEHPLRSRFEKPPEHDAQSLPDLPVIPRNEAFCLKKHSDKVTDPSHRVQNEEAAQSAAR